MSNDEFQFYIPDDRDDEEPVVEAEPEKVSDKQLTNSIIVSVVTILLCMTCLVGLTWAWYSSSTTTVSNKITAASFDLSIEVTENPAAPETEETEETETEEEPAAPVVLADENGYYTLDPEKTYTVKLSKMGTAKTGFCYILAYAPEQAFGTPYCTDSIPLVDDETPDGTEPYVFTVTGFNKLEFTPMWGQCPEGQKHIAYGGTLAPASVEDTPAGFDSEETESEEPEPEDEPEDETATEEKKEPGSTEEPEEKTEGTENEQTTPTEEQTPSGEQTETKTDDETPTENPTETPTEGKDNENENEEPSAGPTEETEPPKNEQQAD